MAPKIRRLLDLLGSLEARNEGSATGLKTAQGLEASLWAREESDDLGKCPREDKITAPLLETKGL